jgi:hypothetical protein
MRDNLRMEAIICCIICADASACVDGMITGEGWKMEENACIGALNVASTARDNRLRFFIFVVQQVDTLNSVEPMGNTSQA